MGKCNRTSLSLQSIDSEQRINRFESKTNAAFPNHLKNVTRRKEVIKVRNILNKYNFLDLQHEAVSEGEMTFFPSQRPESKLRISFLQVNVKQQLVPGNDVAMQLSVFCPT